MTALLEPYFAPDLIPIITSYFDVALSFAKEWSYDESDGLTSPTDIVALKDNLLAVTDPYSDGDTVFILNAEGKIVVRFGSGSERFERAPEAMAMISPNKLAISEGYTNEVRVFTLEGKLIARWTGVDDPRGITTLSGDLVAVVDCGNQRIRILTVEGELVEDLDLKSIAKEECDFDQLVNIGDDVLVLSDSISAEIRILNRHGQCLAKWGSFGEKDGQFQSPSGILQLAENRIAVVDSGNHRIQIFTKDGQFVRKYGTLGDRPGQFNEPMGIAKVGPYLVAVADPGNKRIQLFDLVFV